MVYIKEAEKISDFLRLIRAYNGVMYYEEIKVYREKINLTNRLNNCEQANVDKIIATAATQIRHIELIKEIGKICREKGVIFHTDAVQAAGHLHIDVKEQNIDMLSLSAHKFHGPKGIGALYSRKGIPLYTLIEGGAQEGGKRAGTENIPAIMGMAAALEESENSIDKNTEKISAL